MVLVGKLAEGRAEVLNFEVPGVGAEPLAEEVVVGGLFREMKTGRG